MPLALVPTRTQTSSSPRRWWTRRYSRQCSAQRGWRRRKPRVKSKAMAAGSSGYISCGCGSTRRWGELGCARAPLRIKCIPRFMFRIVLRHLVIRFSPFGWPILRTPVANSSANSVTEVFAHPDVQISEQLCVPITLTRRPFIALTSLTLVCR